MQTHWFFFVKKKGLGRQYFDRNVWGSEDAAFATIVDVKQHGDFETYKKNNSFVRHNHTPLADATSIAWDFWYFRRFFDL